MMRAYFLSMTNLLKVKIVTDPYMVIADFSASIDVANSQNHQSYEFTLAFKIKIF